MSRIEGWCDLEDNLLKQMNMNTQLKPDGAPWFLAFMSGADVSVMSLVGMSLRQVKLNMIVNAKIMGRQAGLNIDRQQGKLGNGRWRLQLVCEKRCHKKTL